MIEQKKTDDKLPNNTAPFNLGKSDIKTIKAMRIIFMGTPEFAVASLDKLVQENCNIVAVITAPDKPAGRGMELQQSAVKKYAVEKKITILQPEKLKNKDFLAELAELKADIQIVVAFRMLPEVVWNMPPMGTINVHGSLLPQYRGAAPINWAVINGEKETGVTTFKLQHTIDTGDILLQKSMPILEDDNVGSIHDKMKILGADLLYETLVELVENDLQPQPQKDLISESELKHAPKLTTETCKINFNQSTDKVFNLIRGLSPFPAAYTLLDGKKLKIFSAVKDDDKIDNSSVGDVISDGKSYLKFKCSDGFISLKEIQLEGKKKMPIEDFLRGYRLSNKI